MRRILLTLLAGVLSIAVTGGAGAAEEGSFIRVPVSVNYAGVYWWRGVELNGKGAGVLWPSAGIVFGDTGLSLTAAAGINADCFMVNESGDEKTARTFHEADYGVAYSTVIGELVSLGAGAMLIKYHCYDEANSDATDPSFYEGSFSIGLVTALSPKVDAYYDYYIEKNGDNPRNEDYYLKFSVSQDLVNAGGFIFNAGAWAGYYRNAYFDRIGWSDAGVKLGALTEHKGLTFASAVYYARSLSGDFQLDYDLDANGKSSKMRNHLWAEFGVSCKI